MSTNIRLRSVCILGTVIGLTLGVGTLAGTGDKNKSMKMDEPMSGEMKKPGMKKGDVKKHEEKWNRKMKSTLQKEEERMPKR